MNCRRRFRKTATATKWRWYIAPGKQHASFTSICAARGLVQLTIIGRAILREITTRLAEAEMTAACFGLGGPPRVGRLFRSADGLINPIPRAASALVELAMTCPGLYYVATSWLPDTENYRHHLLHRVLQVGSRPSRFWRIGPIQCTFWPGRPPSSTPKRKTSLPPAPTATIIPSLTPNFILRGARFAAMTTRRPTSCSGR